LASIYVIADSADRTDREQIVSDKAMGRQSGDLRTSKQWKLILWKILKAAITAIATGLLSLRISAGVANSKRRLPVASIQFPVLGLRTGASPDPAATSSNAAQPAIRSVHHYVNALNAHVNQDEVPLIRSSQDLGLGNRLVDCPTLSSQRSTKLLRRHVSLGGKEFLHPLVDIFIF